MGKIALASLMKHRAIIILLLLGLLIGQRLVASPHEITVSNVPEFLAALGSDRTIILQPGEYDFSQADSIDRPHCRWQRGFAKNELHIVGVNNLKIESFKKSGVRITSQANYGQVIVFEDCNNLTIQNIKIDRENDHATCQGGALAFQNCNNLVLERVQIVAHRPQGLALGDCNHVRVNRCSVRASTQAAVDVTRCNAVLFTDCDLRTNAGKHLIAVEASNSVRFHNCALLDNVMAADSGATYLIAAHASADVGFFGGIVDGNKATYMAPQALKPSFSKVQVRLGNIWAVSRFDPE
jgi:polygalacturonase